MIKRTFLTFAFGLVASVSLMAQTPTPTSTPVPTPNSGNVALPQNPPEIAPDYTAPERPLPSIERIGVDVNNQRTMSLDEAIRFALENSNDIKTSEIDVKKAEFSLEASRGVFDPRMTGQSFFQRSKVPVAQSLGAVDGALTTSSFNNSFGVVGDTPSFGGSYQANFNAARTNSDNPLNTLNPQFPSAFTLSYTQPLLKGLKTDNNRRNIEIAKKNLSLTDSQFRQKSIDVITNVVQAYWDLTYALRNLQVQIDAVKQARAQVESNKRQVQEGVIAPIEIVEAETQVTNFEQQVYVAQQTVTQAENNLKTLLLANSNDTIWTQAIVPTTPVNVEPPKVTVEEALAEARANRPELEQLKFNQEINQINTRYFKDQTKPQIDLVGSYTSNGLAGTVLENNGGGFTSFLGPLYARINELSALNGLPPLVVDSSANPVPGQLVGGYGKSLSNLFSMKYPTYQIGLRIELPFFNRTAKANLGYSLAEGTQIETKIAQQDQLIKADVQNALQAVRAAEARLNAAAASRNSSQLLYDSEKRKLENGTTTIYLVLQRQQNLVTARGQELQAQTALNKAIAAFQKSVGNTFQAHNIELKEVSSNQRLKMTNPASADMDSSGFLKSKPRVTPTISRTVETNSLVNQ